MGALGTLCFGALILLVFLFMVAVIRRFEKREKPPGSYKSPDYHSGGSIGGMRGGRAHDSPDFDSGATIGGNPKRRAHDHPDIDSGASIGGGPSVGESPRSKPSESTDGGWQLGGSSSSDKAPRPYETSKDRGRTDTPDIESGGSFGG
jgi:hypothetical protein